MTTDEASHLAIPGVRARPQAWYHVLGYEKNVLTLQGNGRSQHQINQIMEFARLYPFHGSCVFWHLGE